jgi:PPM family protein phosphatase
MSFESHGISDPGCVRDGNEDRILLNPPLGLYAVCDGMGGHQRGELAADLAIATIQYYLDASRDRFDVSWPFGYNFDLSIDANRLTTAIRLANRQVWRHAEQSLECAGMGSTIAAVLVDGSSVVAGNAGDSRVYVLHDGKLIQISTDDTMVGSMAARGLLSSEQVRTHPMRNVLTQAAGSQEDLDVHIAEKALSPGDRLLIASDGLHGVIEEDAIRSILLSTATPEACSRRLIDSARAAGAPDNVSVVVLEYR